MVFNLKALLKAGFLFFLKVLLKACFLFFFKVLLKACFLFFLLFRCFVVLYWGGCFFFPWVLFSFHNESCLLACHCYFCHRLILAYMFLLACLCLVAYSHLPIPTCLLLLACFCHRHLASAYLILLACSCFLVFTYLLLPLLPHFHLPIFTYLLLPPYFCLPTFAIIALLPPTFPIVASLFLLDFVYFHHHNIPTPAYFCHHYLFTFTMVVYLLSPLSPT